MDWIKNGLISALIDRHGNGATQVVTRYNSYLKSRLKYLHFPFPHDKRFGFLGIAVGDLNTYGFKIYDQIMRDPKAWAQLVEARFTPCFSFDPAREIAPGGSVDQRLKESGAVCDGFGPGTPEYFIHVTMACIEVRHIGGVGEKIGDMDAFNLLAARGFLLHENFGLLCALHRQEIGKNLWQVWWLAVAVAALRLFPADASDPSMPYLIGNILALAVLVWRMLRLNRRLEAAVSAFEHASDHFCHVIAACIHKRQDALIANIDNTIAALKNGERMQLWSQRKQLLWARRAYGLGQLLDWFEKRVEAVKTYSFCTGMQTQMVVPSLLRHHRHEVDKIRHRYLWAGVPALMLVVGLDLAVHLPLHLASLPALPGPDWNDAILGGFLTIATGAAGWLLAKLRRDPGQHIAWDKILHDEAFSSLKGPAEAGVTDKRAKLYEDGHLRDVFDDSLGLPPDDDDGGNPRDEDGSPLISDDDRPHPLI